MLPSSSSQRSRALPVGRGSWVGKRKWRREIEFVMAGIDGSLLFGSLLAEVSLDEAKMRERRELFGKFIKFSWS